LKNLRLFAEYGRYDDLLALLGTKCEAALGKFIGAQLDADLTALNKGENVSLLAKWLPSINTSCVATREKARRICRLLGMKEQAYRKTLSALRARIGIVEDDLRRRDYDFDYAKLPAKALFKYRVALWHNDEERYEAYLRDVRSGRAKMNTSTLYPYEIIRAVFEADTLQEVHSLDTAWNALPDYTDSRNALAVIDGSGSMYKSYNQAIQPIMVALSLGMYFAERNRGYFANHFITFSESPQLVEIKGADIGERTAYCMSYNEIANTDLYEVFMLLLLTAIKNHLPQSDLVQKRVLLRPACRLVGH
jgi:hypothetical protein